MKAIIKKYHSPDILDLENYMPNDREYFSYLLQILVGPDLLNGEESFDIQICSPKWINDNYSKEDVILGRHMIIQKEYNFSRIKSFLINYIDNINGAKWEEIALKISRIGKWEFEDYKGQV
ncbi:MAG: immunity 8 family protein [bacterium]